MSKVVSRDQALGVIATAMANIDWSKLDGDRLQAEVAQLPPRELGRRFTWFLESGCEACITAATVIDIPSGKKWVEIDGIIYVRVVSTGRSGEDWIAYLSSEHRPLARSTKEALQSPCFEGTDGITYTLAIVRGSLFTGEDCNLRKISVEAERCGWLNPHPETSCLLRDLLSDSDLKKLGLIWLVAAHVPLSDLQGRPYLLKVNHFDHGPWFDLLSFGPGFHYTKDGAFAFLVSAVRN